MATQSNKFNFDSYNDLMKGAPVGLKLHLGVQLIKDVVGSLEYFDNPLESEIRPIYTELKSFHTLYKESAKKATAEREEKNNSSKGIDNSTVPTLGQLDAKVLNQLFQQMIAAQASGNLIAAQNAETSMTQVQDGVLHTQGEPQAQAAA